MMAWGAQEPVLRLVAKVAGDRRAWRLLVSRGCGLGASSSGPAPQGPATRPHLIPHVWNVVSLICKCWADCESCNIT